MAETSWIKLPAEEREDVGGLAENSFKSKSRVEGIVNMYFILFPVRRAFRIDALTPSDSPSPRR